jgi:hypothetical protein
MRSFDLRPVNRREFATIVKFVMPAGLGPLVTELSNADHLSPGWQAWMMPVKEALESA